MLLLLLLLLLIGRVTLHKVIVYWVLLLYGVWQQLWGRQRHAGQWVGRNRLDHVGQDGRELVLGLLGNWFWCPLFWNPLFGVVAWLWWRIRPALVFYGSWLWFWRVLCWCACIVYKRDYCWCSILVY